MPEAEHDYVEYQIDIEGKDIVGCRMYSPFGD